VTSAFQEATSKVLPSVVYIEVEGRVNPQVEMFLPFRPDPPGDAPLRPQGSGSGVVFRDDGYILTNNHVVQLAEKVTVTTYDRRTFEAQVVARDPSTDVAVVRIRGRLPVAQLGDSDSLHPGQWVLALGSPLGLRFTVTAGIISATGRALGIIGPEESAERQAAPLETFIQTDAAINPGNSGGPLVDLNGRVVGINSAIASATGSFAGYGFAVPINLARDVAAQLIDRGEVRRPYLGVSLDEIQPVDVKVYRLSRAAGAEVVHIENGGPAEKAGIRLGDVIVGIGARDVGTVAELQSAMTTIEPDTRVPLRVFRDGDTVSVEVKLGLVRSGVRPRATPDTDPAGRSGLEVMEQDGRVVIAAVQPFSAAARAGIPPGSVVILANGRIIKTIAQFRKVLEDANGTLSLVLDAPDFGEVIVNYELDG
jgi:serine protease Do